MRLVINALKPDLTSEAQWSIPLKGKKPVRRDILDEIKKMCDSDEFNPFEDLVDESLTFIMKVVK